MADVAAAITVVAVTTMAVAAVVNNHSLNIS